MTREERKRARRVAIISWLILAVWAAALLCTCANAAADTATAAEPDGLTDALACIGAVWVAWALIKAIVRLDTPRKGRRT